MPASDFINRCLVTLDSHWREVSQAGGALNVGGVDAALHSDVVSSINSPTQTYRYVLPTQLLAKCVDPMLDCRCVQKKRGGRGAFDARSVAHLVIVPFDREHHSVLGGSPEPYLSKPLRCRAVSTEFRDDKRDKAGWDALPRVLDAAEAAQHVEFTSNILKLVLVAIGDRLSTVPITYAVPNRVRLDATLAAVGRFLSDRTGGIRFEAVVAALFAAMGLQFGLYASVRRTAVSSADSQSGSLGDIECVNDADENVAVVEAKDRLITVRHVQDKLPMLRVAGVREAFFLSSVGVDPASAEELSGIVRREFAAGQNVYLLDAHGFRRAVLALFREHGRREFLSVVGRQLDEFGRLGDRQRWAELLRRT